MRQLSLKETRRVQRCKFISFILSTCTAVISGTSLLAWALGFEDSLRLSINHPLIVPNTAFGLLILSIGIIIDYFDSVTSNKSVRSVSLFAYIVALWASLTTSLEYLFQTNLGIDQILFKVQESHLAYPGRPSPETLISFVILSTTLLLRKQSLFKPLQHFLAALTGLIPLIVLTGYFYGAKMRFSFISPTEVIVGMALNTAISFLLLSVSTILLQVQEGWTKLLVSDQLGGWIARRLLLLYVLVPPTIGSIIGIGEESGYFDSTLSRAISMILVAGVFVIVTILISLRLERSENERALSEKRLKENEQLLTTIIHVLPVGVWLADRNGKILQCNPAVKEIWGETRFVTLEQYDQFQGWWEDTGKVVGAHEWALAKAIEKGETHLGEIIRIRSFDGSHKIIMNSAVPLKNEQGDVSGAVVVNIDITEQLRLARQQKFLAHTSAMLLESLDYNQVLRVVLESTVPDLSDWCSIYLKAQNGELHSGPYKYRDSPLKNEISLIMNYCPNPNIKEGMYHVLNTRKPILVSDVSDSDRCRLAQNSWHFELLKRVLKSYVFIPLLARNDVLGILFFSFGESDRRYEEKDFSFLIEISKRVSLAIDNARLYKETQAAVKSREDVLSFVSHDLKNPLSAIILNASLLETLKGESQKDQARLKKIANVIRVSGKRMEYLISELLDIAKLDAGRVRLDIHPIPFVKVLNQIENTFSSIAENKKVKFQIQLDVKSKVILADEKQLYRAVSNLVGNAIKFTPPGGTVVLTVKEFGSQFRISVKDTGPGISAENLPKMFNRFWQARQTENIGSGLGLAIAKGIVEAHKGRIGVESKLGYGSLFYIDLPKHIEISTNKVA